MFTQEEQPLLSGDPDEVDDFVDCDRCLIVDWRGTEEEVIDDALRFLPAGSLSYARVDSADDGTTLRVRFQDREDEIRLPVQPQNNFRVLLRMADLLQPDYEIRLFRCTADSDTNGFLIRPSVWWDEYRSAHPKPYTDVFQDVGEIARMWGLDEKPKSGSASAKPWWKFWG